MKRVNLLYVFWAIAFGIFIWTMNVLSTQGTKTIFGIALTETYSMNVEYASVVSQRRVQQGDKVKKGDTLLILQRSETDKGLAEKLAMINQLTVEWNSKNQILDKEKELFIANQNTRTSELQSQIIIAKKELEVQDNLLKSIGRKANEAKTLKQLELDGLNESLRQHNLQTAQQQKSYDTQRRSNDSYYEAKMSQYKNEVGYFQEEKFRMIILAPSDGVIENVFVLPNDITPQYKELVRINSSTPNRVTGFIHESVATPINLGDTVTLVSAARPEVTSKGVIIGTGNNLVELPLRLRKFVEIRAWGREIYLRVEPGNNFYIGEKILIQIK